MEDLQTSETVSMPRINLDPFIHACIVKVHVISTWLQVVDEVVTKMRFSAGGRLVVNGIQLRIIIYMSQRKNVSCFKLAHLRNR